MKPKSMMVEGMSRRRRMVFHGLRPFAGEEALRFALDLLEREYPASEPFSVTRFVDRLCEQFTRLRSNKGQIYNSISKLQWVDSNQIGPDPAEIYGTTTSAASMDTVHLSAQDTARFTRSDVMRARNPGPEGIFAVFNELIHRLVEHFEQLDRRNIGKLRNYVVSRLGSLGVSADAILKIRQWCQAMRSEPIDSHLSEADMQKLMHVVYLWACEQLGPSEADNLFGRTIKDCERLPEAVQFPPRIFF